MTGKTKKYLLIGGVVMAGLWFFTKRAKAAGKPSLLDQIKSSLDLGPACCTMEQYESGLCPEGVALCASELEMPYERNIPQGFYGRMNRRFVNGQR
jgi:hypothetical protein